MSQDIDSLIRRLKKVIDDSGLSYAELEKKTGVSKSALQRYANGSTKKIPIDVIQSIASAVNVPAAWIMGWADDEEDVYPCANILPLPSLRRIPLLGNIACGDPILAIETSEDSVTIPETLHADFALRCKGDSMVNARILDGDIVYIQRQDDVDNGEIAAVIIDDEATLKRVYKDDRHEQLTLMPENPAYPPLVYRGEELNNIRIIGKVVGFFSSQIK